MSICTLLLTFGLVASCVDGTPVKEETAAEVIRDIQVSEQHDVDDAIARRNRLYKGMGECKGCGTYSSDPFPAKLR